jgi:hypothetical protein
MHSRSGFSGSPVFVFRTAGSVFAKPNTIMGGGHLIKLLGIHWGQFPERWEIKNGKARVTIEEQVIEAPEAYVEGLSGMTCLCPSSAILDLLFDPKLCRMREQYEQDLAPTFDAAPLPPRAEGSP